MTNKCHICQKEIQLNEDRSFNELFFCLGCYEKLELFELEIRMADSQMYLAECKFMAEVNRLKESK